MPSRHGRLAHLGDSTPAGLPLRHPRRPTRACVREDPAGSRPPSLCRKTGLLSPHFPRISRACVRASPRAFAWAPSFPLSLVVQWDLWRFRHLGCVCMNRPGFSRISAGALGNEGGLKLTAPVAIRGHVRNIFRLVGCRKTPASWCSEPAPRSHARSFAQAVFKSKNKTPKRTSSKL